MSLPSGRPSCSQISWARLLISSSRTTIICGSPTAPANGPLTASLRGLFRGRTAIAPRASHETRLHKTDPLPGTEPKNGPFVAGAWARRSISAAMDLAIESNIPTATVLTRSGPSRRLPIGAEVQSDSTQFRLWAPKAATVEIVFDTDAPLKHVQLTCRGGRLFLGPVSAASARRALPLPARRRRALLSGPRLALPARGPARPVEGRRSGGLRLEDTAWRGVRAEGRDLRDARRHLHRRRAPGTPPTRELADSPSSASRCSR